MALSLSTGIAGFLLTLAAEAKSPHTIADYRNNLNKLLRYAGDQDLAEISREDVVAFLASLEGQLAAKTRRNVHTTLRSFWNWAIGEGYAAEHPLDNVRPPRAPEPIIEPLTKAELRAMVKACRSTRRYYHARGERMAAARRPTALRDRAVILMLLDTGIRASECCRMTVGDVALDTGAVSIEHGKGGKSRQVRLGRRGRHALWRYWAERRDTRPEAPAFATVLDGERSISRDVLYRLIRRIGERAGVEGAHPHRLRHTFAISYLRNGGDIYTLQELLGHSSLDMVRRYLKIAESDTARMHQVASPVDNWQL